MPPEAQRDVGRLLIVCPDRPGIVAAVSEFLFEHGANIVHSDQHSTSPLGGTFFMRVEFSLPGLQGCQADVQASFRSQVAERFGMQWWLSPAARRKGLGVFVSRAEHALLELLWQQRAGDLPADIRVVVSNHTNRACCAFGSCFPPGRASHARKRNKASLRRVGPPAGEGSRVGPRCSPAAGVDGFGMVPGTLSV